MHTGLAAASSAAKPKIAIALESTIARFLDSSIVALSEWSGIVWQAKTPLDARALLKQGGKREKQKREPIWGFSLRGVGLVTDAWWQMQFSDLSDWCVTARRSCLLPWIQGSAHLSRDQYSPSPGPVSVINLNIKHVSCHTARERHYPMKRALMNRSRRCDDRAAADEPVSPATSTASRVHSFSFPPVRLLRSKTTWCRWKRVWRSHFVIVCFSDNNAWASSRKWEMNPCWQHFLFSFILFIYFCSAPHSRIFQNI